MSLEALFEDRKSRKYITDSINEARDIGVGHCHTCGSEGHLIRVFGKNLCESCCESALKIAENFEFRFDSISDGDIISMLKEAYIIPDMARVQADANAKFNGSIPDLMKSYKLGVPSDWDDRLGKGWLWIEPDDITSGNTNLNKFLNDYNCVPVKSKAFSNLVPDADGTFCSIGSSTTVNVPRTSSPKATTSTPTKQSSSNLVSTGFNGYVVGDDSHFNIQLGDNEDIDVVKTADANGTKTYELSYAGNKLALTVAESDCKDLKSAVKYLISKLAENPGAIFPAFEDQGSVKEFSISKYPFYKFVLDENSFGKQLSLAIVYQGRVFGGSNRVFVPGKALSSKMLMSAELTKGTDEKIAKQMPAYVANPKFKTSLGVAIFELKDMSNGIAEFNVDLANKKFTGRVDKERFPNEREAKTAYAEMIHNAFMQGLIPEFNDSSIKDKEDYHISFKDGTYYESQGYGVDVYASFNSNDFYDTGNVTFDVSIIDEFSGNEQPKQKRKFVYRKVGVRLSDFLKKCGLEIYDEFFKKSDMQSQMKDSAREKMKSPSKKASLLRKIEDKIMYEFSGSSGYSYLRDLELDLDMKVNNDGKVTSAIITISDPYKDLVGSSMELKNKLKLDTDLKWLKFNKIDKAEKDGPAVVYTVSDIDAFANYVNLSVFESAILEAFNIVQISESGRKTFHV